MAGVELNEMGTFAIDLAEVKGRNVQIATVSGPETLPGLVVET